MQVNRKENFDYLLALSKELHQKLWVLTCPGGSTEEDEVHEMVGSCRDHMAVVEATLEYLCRYTKLHSLLKKRMDKRNK